MSVANSTGGLMLQTMLYLANHTANTLVNLPPNDPKEVQCYGVYGCFPINGPWVSTGRPFNSFPQKPSEIKPHFSIYTDRAFDRPKYVTLSDPDAIQKMGINPNGKLFVIAHGFLESGEIPWMLDMGKALLQREPIGKAAVMLVDWGGGSSPPYVRAVANIRLVGAMTAHIIHMIYEELKMPNLHKVHLIGHSLGAHLSGYVGYYLQRDFNLLPARITGLDPAAPLFTDTDPIVRLDSSDASFVDIIHTDSNPLMKGGLGIYHPIGHADFYPNGGFDNPGCNRKLEDIMHKGQSNFLFTMQQFLGCNHVRSYFYFTESVRRHCPFMGVQCETYESFRDGNCGQCDEEDHLCMRMGYNAMRDYKKLQAARLVKPNKPLVLYLLTGGDEPFCRMHYRITVRVSAHDASTMHGGEVGTISLRLHGEHNKTGERLKFSEAPMYFEPGYEYHALVPSTGIHKPEYATVFWEYQANLLNPLTWRILSSPRIYLEYILVEVLEDYDVYLKLCPDGENGIVAGDENVLRTEYCKF